MDREWFCNKCGAHGTIDIRTLGHMEIAARNIANDPKMHEGDEGKCFRDDIEIRMPREALGEPAPEGRSDADRPEPRETDGG